MRSASSCTMGRGTAEAWRNAVRVLKSICCAARVSTCRDFAWRGGLRSMRHVGCSTNVSTSVWDIPLHSDVCSASCTTSRSPPCSGVSLLAQIDWKRSRICCVRNVWMYMSTAETAVRTTRSSVLPSCTTVWSRKVSL